MDNDGHARPLAGALLVHLNGHGSRDKAGDRPAPGPSPPIHAAEKTPQLALARPDHSASFQNSHFLGCSPPEFSCCHNTNSPIVHRDDI